MDYLKLISEKWNLTAKFNCLQAIYVDAPIALAVPMCGLGLGLGVAPVGVTFNINIYHRSNCRRSKCRTFARIESTTTLLGYSLPSLARA